VADTSARRPNVTCWTARTRAESVQQARVDQVIKSTRLFPLFSLFWKTLLIEAQHCFHYFLTDSPTKQSENSENKAWACALRCTKSGKRGSMRFAHACVPLCTPVYPCAPLCTPVHLYVPLCTPVLAHLTVYRYTEEK
jgi:hypothetical protein